ncbi:nuclear transport factor 2 (ntf2) domain-containing protein [Cardiosporidium cionae]|uniref:Nuclear transport factor 2 (Ntf2) domain-containing protein n=1 Tax=Cardiosporidium cionae TaxID=476202 RepID=A0ABQ7J721_9APIC|nr:nuclear transport factor 2 (ntf2) domain-containing protein [Cardiosporidium cionae]|eukprot:KAF8819719.1 nuclear transport factor 2 (ntf2) domain-containing protein [Cardiosporidium cionae]
MQFKNVIAETFQHCKTFYSFIEEMACIQHNSPLSTVVTPPAHYASATINSPYPFAYGQPSIPSVNSFPQSPVASHGVIYPSVPPALHVKDCSLPNALDSNYEAIPAAALPAATVVPSSIGAQEVAHSFVFQYFSMLHVEPQNLHLFYDEDSKLSRLSEGHSSSSPVWWKAYGQREIYEGFEKYLVKNTTSQIHCIEAQESNDGSILLLVTGSLTIVNEPPREFVQSVYLAKQKPNRKGWYIKNEIFLFVDTPPPQTNEATEGKITDDKIVPEITENEITTEEAVPPQATGTKILHEQASEDWNIDETYRNTSGNANTEAQQPPIAILHESSANAVEKKSEEVATILHTEEMNWNKEGVDSTLSAEPANSTEKMASQSKVHGIGRHWGEAAPILNSSPDPSWPKLGETINQKTANPKDTTEDLCSRYDSSSFASKLMRNVNSKGIFQRGYALQASKDEKVTHEENSDAALSGSTDANKEKPLDVASGKNDRTISSRKKIRVMDFPRETSDDVVKRSIASQLRNFNDGHVIEITKPFIELDCRQSVEYLVKNGWWLNGHQMRIEYVGRLPTSRGGEQESHSRPSYANRNAYDTNSKYPHRGNYNPRNEESKRNAPGKSAVSTAGPASNSNGKESSASPTTATSSGTNTRDNNTTTVVCDAPFTQENKAGEYRNNPSNRTRQGVERVSRANNGSRNTNWTDTNSKRKPRIGNGGFSNAEGTGGKNTGNVQKTFDRPAPMNREALQGSAVSAYAAPKS